MTWDADRVDPRAPQDLREDLPGDLVVRPCLSLCRWVPARGRRPRLFACQGCGSQWRPGLAWTPVDADGTVPEAVRRAVTSAPTADAVDRADSRTTSDS
jgi:hypothetical protein